MTRSIKFGHDFKLGDVVTYTKGKKCEKKGKCHAQYITPYQNMECALLLHKHKLKLTKVGVEKISLVIMLVGCLRTYKLAKLLLVGFVSHQESGFA